MVEDVAEFLLVAWAPCHFVHLGTGLIVRVGAADVVEEFLELGGEVPIGQGRERGALEGQFAVRVVAVALHAEIAEGEGAFLVVALDGGVNPLFPLLGSPLQGISRSR